MLYKLYVYMVPYYIVLYKYLCTHTDIHLYIYRVKMSALGREIHFVIMSSVFDTEKPIHVKYDLKGSTIGRITKQASCDKGAVQKDCNLMQSGRTLYFGDMGETLRKTLVSDSNFLAKLMIMDYSLLVGVHDMRSRKMGRRHSSVVKPGGNSDGSVTMLDEQNESHEATSAPMTKFQSYEGGVRSAEGTYEIYYIGIIDILQVSVVFSMSLSLSLCVLMCVSPSVVVSIIYMMCSNS